MFPQKLELTNKSMAQLLKGPGFLVDFRHLINLDDLVRKAFSSDGGIHFFVHFIIVLLQQR